MLKDQFSYLAFSRLHSRKSCMLIYSFLVLNLRLIRSNIPFLANVVRQNIFTLENERILSLKGSVPFFSKHGGSKSHFSNTVEQNLLWKKFWSYRNRLFKHLKKCHRQDLEKVFFVMKMHKVEFIKFIFGPGNIKFWHKYLAWSIAKSKLLMILNVRNAQSKNILLWIKILI